jgi:hypothetical protein
MSKRIFLIFVLFLIVTPLVAQETTVYQGKRNRKSLADPFLLQISSGPTIPDDEFKKLALPVDRFDSAIYRATYARHEIYAHLNVDLIGLFEDLGREVVVSYSVPLDEALDFDRGSIEILRWDSFNTFTVKLKGLKPDFQAQITILHNGRFKITKR